MPAIDYAYDPMAVNPLNLITGEEQAVNLATNRSVFPQHGPYHGHLLVVEGFSSGVWTPLRANEHYFHSPAFMEATARAGSEVFTYFVISTTNISRVRYKYHAFGQYTDDMLLATLANKVFDRSSVLEWKKIDGSVLMYHPAARHPDVIGRTYTEVVNAQLERILQAISNPHTGNNVTAHDLTNIAAQLSQMVTRDEVKDLHTYPTAVKNVEAMVRRSIYAMDESNRSIRGFITFKAKDGLMESFDFAALLVGATVYPNYFGFTTTEPTGKVMTKLEVEKAGPEYRLMVTADREGDYILKVYAQFS